MKRRDFVATFLATALVRAGAPSRRPRLLIAEEDPFCGLPLLKARYETGLRPSEDMAGLALSWRLTLDNSLGDRALAEMRAGHPPVGGKSSRTWADYVRWSLAFDWLYDHPGFDNRLKDRVAQELADGAAAMLATPDMADPSQVYYHNYTVRYLALAAFPLAAVEGHGDLDKRCGPLRAQVEEAFANILETTNLVSPEGSYHESLDYMRITWASLVLLAELHRTSGGFDPAHHFSLFRNIGDTYLYKLLPDGTPSRENDQEWPLLDARDSAVLGYAVNRFKDPYSAWFLRESGFAERNWILPVLEFLWNDPEVVPRNPALASERELPRQRYFPGVGQLVIRDGWKPDSIWMEFDCGPYFAKHQHLDQNQFTIYHNGYLAIDSGADYTEIESPHYLNYYRRTVAHNTMLVYDPSEKFFWADNLLTAANDGGQRMDSARYWNTVHNRDDWNRTRELWNLASMRVIDSEAGHYHYAMGDASNAYSGHKLRRFTREIVYVPGHRTLFVFDRVVSTNAAFRKAWLLHGVNEPAVSGEGHAAAQGTTEFPNARTFRFNDATGELLVHSLLPRNRTVTRRGGPGYEFFTPGDDHGGDWGTGENWPLDPPGGGPLPKDPRLQHMWKVFYGEDFAELWKSNRKNVVPGAWRIEVSPATPAEEDLFLHVLEIGDHGTTGSRRVELLEGINFAGAAVEGGPAVLFSTAGAVITEGEATLPGIACDELLITSLQPKAIYDVNFFGPEFGTSPRPGVSAGTLRPRSNDKGILRIDIRSIGNARVRVARV
jgi:hypothetical protein